MASTPTSSTAAAPRWRVATAVAVVVVGMVGGVVALAGSADDPPTVPSMGPLLAIGDVVPTPGPLLPGGVAVDAGTTPAPAVDPVVEATAATPPTPTPASPAPAAPPAPDTVPAGPAVAAPSTPPVTDPQPASIGTLEIQVSPVGDGSSLQVRVATADGTEVLGNHEVTGPIVLELAPGPYEVFIQRTGPPSGPDENGVELGGGSMVTRDQVEVVAGRTTTVTCSICAPM